MNEKCTFGIKIYYAIQIKLLNDGMVSRENDKIRILEWPSSVQNVQMFVKQPALSKGVWSKLVRR